MGIVLSIIILILLITMVVCVRKFHVKRQEEQRNGTMNMIQNDINRSSNGSCGTDSHKKNARIRNQRKLNNYELVSREQQDLPLLPQRPVSISPTVSETPFNYMDTVRSYGSAADELETLPRIPHHYITDIQKPIATVAPSLISDRDMNLKDNYFRKKSPALDSTRPSSSSSLLFRHAKLRVNLPPDTGDETCQSELSLEDEYQRYHWDCSDWANQATLPALSELPNGEVMESANSWVNEMQRKSNTSGQPIPFNLNEPVDPTRDIETLAEDVTNAGLENSDNEGNEGDVYDDDQLGGAVYPDSPMHQTNKSIEELMLASGVNFADDEDNVDEIPNAYDYKLHLNSYLPTYHLGSDPETDEATPMLGSGQPSNRLNGFPSPDLGSYSSPGGGIRSPIRKSVGAGLINPGRGAVASQNTVGSDYEDKLCILEDVQTDPSAITDVIKVKRTPSPKVTQV